MNQDLNQKLAEIRNNMIAITKPQLENEVNTNQQTQPQTIQVRITRKTNKAAQVRKILRTNPNLTPKQIAEMVGCNPHTVHNVKYNLKKKRKAKVVVAKPTQTTQSQAKTFGHLVHLSPIKTALSHFTMDLVSSGNTDLLKNKHFQTLVKLTTTSETDQL
jgi:septal ring-binding cell division protein DamX